jgi:hypothetical protein
MVPQLIARVDGLPEVLLDREVVWPVPGDDRDRNHRPLSAKARARIERQTAVVHAAILPAAARAVLQQAATESPYLDAEAERSEIRAMLAGRGVL